ncbi:hypothetical protein AGDE_12568 [Angomonas deanei]|uniref:Uncharacterized protein n=1 Tax=Angomonas deanei TaxID=59799 RepID=A0A7G2CDV6_9TRYP|nr:hypothetical protein AGDE_12568 [Angomonas deanei]CAD2217211.1 hypothetical protein, conserved [Angomonas deanei]|eukprot:EPY24025.1 hypothetical protein AGDE_12568 [Angomonas deanei]
MAMGGAAAGGCQLTEPERQGVVEHVGKVLEGARRLGVEGLTALCGALIANTVVDVSNDKLKNIVSTKGKGAEPLTPERRKELLQKFPALNPQSA